MLNLKLFKNVKPANNSLTLTKVDKIDLGFGVGTTLKTLRTADLVSKVKVTEFKKEGQQLVIAMVSKFIEKIPLGSDFLLSLSVLHPQFLSSRPRSTVLDRWKIVLTHILKLNILSTKCCDEAMSEFKLFLDGNVMKFKQKLMEFSIDERLDELYFDTLSVSRFKKLALVVALVLTLMSHGAASVERSFSQNNNLIQVNMSPDTIFSKRIIKDHMLAINLKPYTITIDSSVMKAFRSARTKYEGFLKSEKEKKSASEKETQALQMSSDIESLCIKCNTLERTIKMSDTDFIQCIKSAEEKHDMSLVKKGNALKRKSEETKSGLDILLNEVKNLREKRR